MASLAASAQSLPFARFRNRSILTSATSITLTICLAIGLGAVKSAEGQALATADRRFAIAPFGLGSYMRPEFLQHADVGYAAGVDLTPVVFRRFEPSLEIRMTGNSGSLAKELTYAAGLKAATTFRGIHPYGTFLEGVQTIYLEPPRPTPKGPYAHDSSRMMSLGGGAEFDLGPAWQAKLDYSKQYWVLNSPGIRPLAISAGISYRIPFRRGGGVR